MSAIPGSFPTGGIANIGSIFSAAGGLVNGVAGGVGQLMSASGDQAEAQAFQVESKQYGQQQQAYTEAAGYARGEVPVQQELTRIQEYQSNQQLLETQGAARSQAGAQGLRATGASSAGNILSMNARQGALAQGLIGVQGAQQEQVYRAQATGDLKSAQEAGLAAQEATLNSQAEEDAASSATTSGALQIGGGILGALGAAFSFFK